MRLREEVESVAKEPVKPGTRRLERSSMRERELRSRATRPRVKGRSWRRFIARAGDAEPLMIA